jgi:RNA polymerase sigma-70 factor (ECF subfamily)
MALFLSVETGLEPERTPSFREQFAQLFDAHFPSVYRYLNRVSGDPELAADVAQETFVKLYQRGSVPDTPGAWLISVALNLFRNAASTRRRRLRLLTQARGESVLADPPPAPDQALEADESRERVRLALDRMPERERSLLLLQAEGYSYREIAMALELNEASVGVFLARARRTFREIYEESSDAS